MKFYAEAQRRRSRVTSTPDQQWPVKRIHRDVGKVLAEVPPPLLLEAFDLFLSDPEKGRKDWPMWIFVQDFGQYVEIAKQPKCARCHGRPVTFHMDELGVDLCESCLFAFRGISYEERTPENLQRWVGGGP